MALRWPLAAIRRRRSPSWCWCAIGIGSVRCLRWCWCPLRCHGCCTMKLLTTAASADVGALVGSRPLHERGATAVALVCFVDGRQRELPPLAWLLCPRTKDIPRKEPLGAWRHAMRVGELSLHVRRRAIDESARDAHACLSRLPHRPSTRAVGDATATAGVKLGHRRRRDLWWAASNMSGVGERRWSRGRAPCPCCLCRAG